MNGSHFLSATSFENQSHLPVVLLVAICLVKAIHPSPCANGMEPNAAKSYVLLRNDQVLTGRVHTEDHDVVIHRDGDSTLRLPTYRVVGVSQSESEVVNLRRRYLARRGSGQTSKERAIAEARWCLDNQLFSSTRSILSQLLRIIPGDRKSLSMWQELQSEESKSRNNEGSLRLPPVQLATHTNAAQAINPIATAAFVEEPKGPEHSAEELGLFASQIQPVLLARCVGCHQSSAGAPPTDQSGFALHRAFRGGRPGHTTTSKNLSALDAWLVSSGQTPKQFLQYATKIHWPLESFAPRSPAIASREERLAQRLAAWVQHRRELAPTNTKTANITDDSADNVGEPGTQSESDQLSPPGFKRLPGLSGQEDQNAQQQSGNPSTLGARDADEFNRQTDALQTIRNAYR